jgi:hypothetical protein
MKFYSACFAAALVLTGCVSDGTGLTAGSSSAVSAPSAYSDAMKDACWKRAGIQSELNHFLTAEEALVLQANGAITQSGLNRFKTCMAGA